MKASLEEANKNFKRKIIVICPLGLDVDGIYRVSGNLAVIDLSLSSCKTLSEAPNCFILHFLISNRGRGNDKQYSPRVKRIIYILSSTLRTVPNIFSAFKKC